jgi:hypothetical protein
VLNQERITLEQKEDKIIGTLEKMNRTIGVMLPKNKLEQEEKIKREAPVSKGELRNQAMKNIISSFFQDTLLMTSSDYKALSFIHFRHDIRNDNKQCQRQTIFIEFDDTTSTNAISRHFKNLHDDQYSIVNYVTKEALPRYRAVEELAKKIHTTKGLNTKIRTGKFDFKLITRAKGDKTPWSECTAVILPPHLPEFNIGIVHNELQEEDQQLTDSRYTNKIENNKKYFEPTLTQDSDISDTQTQNDNDLEVPNARIDDGVDTFVNTQDNQDTQETQEDVQDNLQDNEQI